MIIPGYAFAVGRGKGEVEKDEEGMRLVGTLGQRMAGYLRSYMNRTDVRPLCSLPAIEFEKKRMTTEKIGKCFTSYFILVFFAQVAFTVVGYILIPTLPVYLARLGSKETEIGVLIGSYGVSSLVFRPFVGRAL